MHPLGTLLGMSPERKQKEAITQSSQSKEGKKEESLLSPIPHWSKLIPLEVNSTALSDCVIHPPHRYRVLPQGLGCGISRKTGSDRGSRPSHSTVPQTEAKGPANHIKQQVSLQQQQSRRQMV